MVVILWYMYMPAVAYRMMYPVEPGRMVMLETVSVLVWVGGWGCSNGLVSSHFTLMMGMEQDWYDMIMI